MIYFIKATYSNAIKIGFSNDPKQRLASLQTGSAEPLEMIGVIPGQIADEKRLHGKFAGFRMSGEWFKGTPELLSEIRGMLQLSIPELVADTGARLWVIRGEAANDSGGGSCDLFCVRCPGSEGLFPDPDEMVAAAWSDRYSFYMIHEIADVTRRQDLWPVDQELLRVPLTSSLSHTWVADFDSCEVVSRFKPVMPPHPTDFLVPGASVLHPQYGLGEMLAIDGTGPNRKGHVRFAVGGEKIFVLSKSPLRPVNEG